MIFIVFQNDLVENLLQLEIGYNFVIQILTTNTLKEVYTCINQKKKIHFFSFFPPLKCLNCCCKVRDYVSLQPFLIAESNVIVRF